MKEFFKKVWHFIKTSTLLKYAVVAVFAVVFIGFVDENSVWSHFRNMQTISDLQLDKDPKAIEKIARERYFMKEDDEDIFILSDDQPDEAAQPTDHETAE